MIFKHADDVDKWIKENSFVTVKVPGQLQGSSWRAWNFFGETDGLIVTNQGFWEVQDNWRWFNWNTNDIFFKNQEDAVMFRLQYS